MLKIVSLFVFLMLSLQVISQRILPPVLQVDRQWCDSVMEGMTMEQKIGQLIMVTTYPSNGQKNEVQLEKWIKEQYIGGVLFLKTTPKVLSERSSAYQQLSKIPLFIAIDGENGLSFRLDSVVKYPHLMGLGAIADDTLLYRMGREVGQQCRMLGINVNFAPVADVNSNQNNPVINYRSFGELPQNVARKTWQLAKGMQDEKIIVSIKHFPGHGDTNYDSHLVLPVVDHSYARLDSVDFVPFKYSIDRGINGIMTAHISIPAVDSTSRPSTLSKKVMTEILRDSLGFQGIVFSDGMNMKGITKYFDEGKAAVEALKAGVDVIEFVLTPEKVIAAIKKAIENKEITDSLIDAKCRKILLAKTWAGITKPMIVKSTNKKVSLVDSEYQNTAYQLYKQSITVLKNSAELLPLQKLDTLRIATLAIGEDSKTAFQKMISKYVPVDHYFIPLNANPDEVKKTISRLMKYNLVLAGVHGTRMSNASNYSIKTAHIQAIEELLKQNKAIVSFFANPYSINQYTEILQANAIVVTYGESDLQQELAAQLIFGAIGANGKLPVSINANFTAGSGADIKPIGRLRFGMPEEEGVDSELLRSTIDSFAYKGIEDKLFPGCQIVVAKNGSVLFSGSYGFFTYDKNNAVSVESLYDLASITKIVGPLPLLMKLVEDSLLKLDVPFYNYWPSFINYGKASITLTDLLTHQAGFKSSVNYIYDVMGNKGKTKNFRDRPSGEYPIRVADKLYITKNFKSNLYNAIAKSDRPNVGKYVYTDIPFLIFPDVIQQLFNCDFATIHSSRFLAPMGISNMVFNPYKYYNLSQIVPTEIDYSFRKNVVHGFVHDEGAAMLGGVSGNAGLFSNAEDLAKVMQFYLNGGNYGDFNFLTPKTVTYFATAHFSTQGNRRGVGFDMPYANNSKLPINKAYPAPAVGQNSFGHSGFTGTFTWADPRSHLIFVFLSNRTFPSRENRKLIDQNFRIKLQQSIYNCMNTFVNHQY